ncbi:hypothetical protein BaRGS_00016328 [Batillaria attramentaria]|uniref:VWFD domain-containing protein n=1 Tax=Batillaria attramentaria TaxID=370345 RepID=A0ABD0KZ30_9CAEN
MCTVETWNTECVSAVCAGTETLYVRCDPGAASLVGCRSVFHYKPYTEPCSSGCNCGVDWRIMRQREARPVACGAMKLPASGCRRRATSRENGESRDQSVCLHSSNSLVRDGTMCWLAPLLHGSSVTLYSQLGSQCSACSQNPMRVLSD